MCIDPPLPLAQPCALPSSSLSTPSTVSPRASCWQSSPPAGLHGGGSESWGRQGTRAPPQPLIGTHAVIVRLSGPEGDALSTRLGLWCGGWPHGLAASQGLF
eukprot:scaffold30832_cov67-Phaeocystis_antarctica.AAC.3